MQLIEVSGDAIMPDPNEWLTKQMTQEQDTKTHSHRKNDGPTTQQRRKHQITYLAFQVWIKTSLTVLPVAQIIVLSYDIDK